MPRTSSAAGSHGSRTRPTPRGRTCTSWLRGYADGIRATTYGGAYVNYPDAGLPDGARAYFGANHARLQRVKTMYDPTDLFASPQGVKPL